MRTLMRILAFVCVFFCMGQEAHATVSCTMTANSGVLNFGTVNVLNTQSSNYPTASTTFTLTCTRNGSDTSTTATVCLNINGATTTSGTSYYTMSGSGVNVGYQLFSDAAYQNFWGNLTVPSPDLVYVPIGSSGTGSVSVTMYGRMINTSTTTLSQLAPGTTYTASFSNSNTAVAATGGTVTDCSLVNQSKVGFSFTVTATVAAQCLMSTAANDLNFGTVPTSAGTVTGSTAFGVTCTNGTPYYIGLIPSNTNLTGAGVMTSVANAATNTDQVPYQLRSTSGTSGTIWGNTATSTSVGNGVAGTGTGSAASYNIYGTATVANYTPDSYQDQVVINVNY